MVVEPSSQHSEHIGRQPLGGETSLEMRERKRVVDRLKDGPGQVLANLAMELRSLLYMLDTNIDDARPILENMLKELEDGLNDLQEIVEELYPPMTFRELGLIPWLREIAARYEANYPVKIRVDVQSDLREIPPKVESIFYRVTQEALRNVIQHADANEVVIRVQQSAQGWRLEITDDGRGFDMDALATRYAELNVKETFGLTLMQQLAEGVNGTLSLFRHVPKGTTVRLEVPWEMKEGRSHGTK